MPDSVAKCVHTMVGTQWREWEWWSLASVMKKRERIRGHEGNMSPVDSEQ